MHKIRVGIIGTGNIGTDLGERLLRNSQFELVAIIGRRPDSPGLKRFMGRVPVLSSNGAKDLQETAKLIDGFFDATSADDSPLHWKILQEAGKWLVDLTPSGIGTPLVPELVGLVEDMNTQKETVSNYSMVTCGGQSGAPLAYALAKNSFAIKNVEISSSIAARSAGPATRNNIDKYIETTENLISNVCKAKESKAILVLNPAEPPVMMRTTITIRAEDYDVSKARFEVAQIVDSIKRYVPGYEVVVSPHIQESGVLSATVKVTGAGYFLPSYAGNLDIINAAAVQTAISHSHGTDDR
jgi:acetaldehyde dehydrogenase (acetylating)